MSSWIKAEEKVGGLGCYLYILCSLALNRKCRLKTGQSYRKERECVSWSGQLRAHDTRKRERVSASEQAKAISENDVAESFESLSFVLAAHTFSHEPAGWLVAILDSQLSKRAHAPLAHTGSQNDQPPSADSAFPLQPPRIPCLPSLYTIELPRLCVHMWALQDSGLKRSVKGDATCVAVSFLAPSFYPN